MVQKRSWLHARSSLCAQPLPSIPALLATYPVKPGMEPSSLLWLSLFCCCLLSGTTGCCKVHFGCVFDMQPVHDEMPVVIKIFAQLLYDNNLPINNYIFCVRTVVSLRARYLINLARLHGSV